jgi:hypothetical protein
MSAGLEAVTELRLVRTFIKFEKSILTCNVEIAT